VDNNSFGQNDDIISATGEGEASNRKGGKAIIYIYIGVVGHSGRCRGVYLPWS